MSYRVMKAKSRNSKRPILDSTHHNLREANARLNTLRASYEHTGYYRMFVWLEELDEAVDKYQRPPHGRWRGYNDDGPKVGGRSRG